MTRAATCGLFASMAFLAGCGLQSIARHAPPSGPPRPCNPGLCEIEVSVSSCGAAGGIVVDKPYVAVDSARNFRWRIVTPGYVFSSSGIAFDPPDPQFMLQFSPHPNEFRIHNAKWSNGDFAYFVNVQGCAPLDPWIKNQ